MESVVLVIHLILALAIIALVLLQRSEGGGLGIGGGGIGNLASARGTANALTKMTAICALGFFITSLTLGVLAGGHSRQSEGILANINAEDVQAPAEVTAPVGIEYIAPDEVIPTQEEPKPEPQTEDSSTE